MNAPLQWGAFAPQGWKLEYTGWSAADAWDRTKELAHLTEQLGFHHLWVYDHVETVPRREPTHMFEAFTTLAALAQHTSTIKLGQMVTCAAYRNPGLLAKEAACVDVFSGGRFILGIGAGWYEREYQAYGFPFPSAGTRLQILEETVEVIKKLWTEETVTYQGKHLAFDGAYCDPKPIQDLPEIWIGGGGEKVTLRIEARHADKTNWQVGIEGFVRKSNLFARLLRRDRPRLRLDRAHARPRLPGLRHRSRPAEVDGFRLRWFVVGRRRPRRVRPRQPRGHRRTGRGEGAGIRRRRLSGVRLVVPRLPVVGEPGSRRARSRAERPGLSTSRL